MVSLLGILILPAIAFLMSTNRSRVSWRTVAGAFAFQAGIGAFVLYIPIGKQLLLVIA